VWKKDDVHPLGIAFKNASCLTGHLTAFVVLRVIIGISANYVVGIVVAVVMGILVFFIMVALFVNRKKEDNSVSPMPENGPQSAMSKANANNAKNVKKKKLQLNSNRIQHERHLNLVHTETTE
jgi:mannitol-specific phosphotransferase system IIBC component